MRLLMLLLLLLLQLACFLTRDALRTSTRRIDIALNVGLLNHSSL